MDKNKKKVKADYRNRLITEYLHAHTSILGDRHKFVFATPHVQFA